VPEDKILRADLGVKWSWTFHQMNRNTRLSCTLCPKSLTGTSGKTGSTSCWRGDQNEGVREEFRSFKRQVLENFKILPRPGYRFGSINIKEAVCIVFEKVNTGGKALDAFELVTAMYAASGHELRKDWYGDDGTEGRHRRLAETYRLAGANTGIIAEVSNTDFLHAISLFHTRDRRRSAESAGKQGKELPAVTGNRQALLNPALLTNTREYQVQVERGFVQAAKFLHLPPHLPHIRPSLSIPDYSAGRHPRRYR